MRKTAAVIGIGFLSTVWLTGCVSDEMIIQANWKMQLPDGGKELYHADTGASFHGDGVPQWPQRSRHALVQPLSASVLQIVTPLLDDFPAVIDQLRAGLSRIWTALPEAGHLSAFTAEKVNQQTVRIVLPETLFERLYTAENFQGHGPEYVAYRNEVYQLVADGLTRQLPLLTYLFSASPADGHRAFWPSPDQ